MRSVSQQMGPHWRAEVPDACSRDAELADAALAALMYADLFDCPLSAEEVHSGLSVRCNAVELASALRWAEGSGMIERVGEFYALPQRAEVWRSRRRRQRESEALWQRARTYAALSASLPGVEMVGVTGALARDNAATDDDIDLMVVCQPGAVWSVRALTGLLRRLARARGDRLCPNYILSTEGLVLEAGDLYSAHELLYMVPLYGVEVYQRMLALNPWARVMLPNHRGTNGRHPPVARRTGAMWRLLEAVLAGRAGRLVSELEWQRWKHKSNRLRTQPEVVLTREQFKLHDRGHRVRIMALYERRLQERVTARLPTSGDSRAPRQQRRESAPAIKGRSGVDAFPTRSPTATEVLLGQSYYLRFDPKLWAAMQPYPPLGTLYAASYLRQRGYGVAVFDAMLAENESEWEDALAAHQPQLAVIYEDSFNYLSKMCLLRMRQAAFGMLATAKQRGCVTAVSASDATDHIEEYISHGADYVLIGEAELTLAELTDVLAGRSSRALNDIAGLAYRGPRGLVRTRTRALIKDLDELPFPAWDMIDTGRYRSAWQRRHGYYSMNMVTTRGCPYHCNWCAKPIYGQRYNVRTPDNVVAELRWLKECYGPDHIWFCDDIFGLKPGWIERFARLVITAEATVPFKCLLRVDLVTEAVASALREAGCRTVWLGAESGSQSILDAMDKGTSVSQIYQARRLLGEAGIEVGFFLQFGYPGEVWQDIQQTLKMVRECQPDDIGVSVSYPLPGTAFYERVKASLGAQANWYDSADLAMLYRGTFSPDFYRVLHALVHEEFRLRKTVRALCRRPPRAADLHQATRLPSRLVRMWRGQRRLQALRLGEQGSVSVQSEPGVRTADAAKCVG
jgi:radical SAM superfamily enzyme YgiQ (UPF0313 family)/predicted nucleotidyltransferase